MSIPLPIAPSASLEDPAEKLTELRRVVLDHDSLVVAVSGGVDSSLVWAIARQELGERALGATALSPSLSTRERRAIAVIVEEIGGPHVFVETQELEDPNYTANPPDRCYFCKVALWKPLSELARARGFSKLADGLNVDDLSGHRPGHRAGLERSVVSPLAEAGLTKADVRACARRIGLSNWNKPAMACLASRFASGVSIDADRLSRVDRAEQAIFDLGVDQLRVRIHGDGLARIEVRPEDFDRVLRHRERILAVFGTLGFAFVSMDIGGFRSGSMSPEGEARG